MPTTIPGSRRVLRPVATIVVLLAVACNGGDDPVRVATPVASAITVTAPLAELAPAETSQLTATVTDQRGATMTGPSVTWASSAPTVVTVDATGLARAAAPGTARISASTGSVSGSVTITVVSTKVSPDAEVVDSTRLRMVIDTTAQARGEYRFTISGTPPTIAVGKILVGAQGGGFLARVLSTRVEGNQLVVQTTPAAITDIIKAGHFALKTQVGAGLKAPLMGLRESGTSTVTPGRPRIEGAVTHVRQTASGWDLSPFNLDLCVKEASSAACATVALKFPRSEVAFAPTPDINWDVDYLGLQRFSLALAGTLSWDAVAELKLGYKGRVKHDCTLGVRSGAKACPRVVKKILGVAYPFTVMVGPVPVLVEVVVEFNLAVSLTGEASVTTNLPFAIDVPLGAGFKLERGTTPTFTGVGLPHVRSTGSPSVTGADASIAVKGALVPTLKLRFYKSASGFVELEPSTSLGLEFSTASQALDVVWGWGMALNLGAELAIFGKTLAEASTELAGASGEFSRWRIAGRRVTRLAVEPATPSLAIGQSLDLKLSAYAEDNSPITPLPAVQWASSNSGVAAVDGNGRLTAKAAGRSTVTATTSDGVQGTAVADVINVVATPVVSVASATWDAASTPPRIALDVLAFDVNGARLGNFPADAFSIASISAGSATLGFQSLAATPLATAVRGPVSTAIVIDQSGSMSSTDPAKARITGARQLVRQFLSGDEAALYTFASSPSRLLGITTDVAALDAELAKIGAPSGGTAIYDAAAAACDYLSTSAHNTNRTVVLLTDGADGSSRTSVAGAISNCKTAGVRLYTVGFGGASGSVLARLALETGGTAAASANANLLLAAMRSLPGTMRGGEAVTSVEFGVTSSRVLPAGTIVSGVVNVDLGAGTPARLLGVRGNGRDATSQIVSAPFTVTTSGPASSVPVATVSVALGAATLAVGQTTTATATLKDAQGNVLSGRSVVWSSSNQAAATIDGAGLVTAKGAGTAVITATSEQRAGSATLTVSGSALSLRYQDGFSAGLGNWVAHSGEWTIQGGALLGEYDISCGSADCSQGQLLLADALQPTTTSWRAEIQISQVRYPYGPGYDLTNAYAAFALWVSASEKVQVFGGYSVNNVAMPATLSEVQWGAQRYPWTDLGSGVTSVAPWSPTQWNTLALERRGNEYTISFNGVMLKTYTLNFSQPPKIGLNIYGRSLMDNFRLLTP